MAGYSKTPLAKKLGMKAGQKLLLINAPDNYDHLIGDFPENVVRQDVSSSSSCSSDFIHAFYQYEADLADAWPMLKRRLKVNGGMLWISWPKGTSKLPKDMNEHVVRSGGLDVGGLVDVKKCAVDEDWSGLKFVYRLEDRKRKASKEEKGSSNKQRKRRAKGKS